MSTAISVRLPEPLARQLAGVAKETERSRAYHVQKALEVYIAEHAELQIAVDRLRDHTDAVISSRALRSKLGI
ncbi:MAG: DNA-binding protein [bacterium]|nr:DNA-binding protein [bacterium]